MKIVNLALLLAVALASFGAFSDQGDVLLTFSTPGPDLYADGTTVKDGEWYAVCWSADGTFHGFTTACQAVSNATEELILASPLAKDGKCPLVAFEFARKAKYSTGRFAVFMLDTRDASGAVAARGADGLPVFVRGAEVTMTSSERTQAQMGVSVATSSSASGGAGYAASQIQADAVAAEISSFEIVGANVQMKVSGLVSDRVLVRTGSTVDQMNTFELPATAAGDAATFIVPKDKGHFFSVVSLPTATK